MNDYIQTPDGHRFRYIRPAEADNRKQLIGGQMREPGVAYIDQWQPPEPPEAA